MLNRVLSVLALCAGTIFLTACATGGSDFLASSSSPQLYAFCNQCNGVANSSGLYSYALNSSSPTATSLLTANDPWVGLQIDSKGRIYVALEQTTTTPYADSFKVYAAGTTGASPTPARTITSSEITPDYGLGGFDFANDGTLYYSDNNNGYLTVFAPTAGTNATPTLTNSATTMQSGAVDSAGNLYMVADLDLNVLPAGFTSSTVPVNIDYGPIPRFPAAVSVDSSGNVYVVGSGSGKLYTGNYLTIIPRTLTGATVTPIKVLTLTGNAYVPSTFPVAVDSAGNIYSVASLNPLVINEYSANAATGTTPTPVNTITTTLQTSSSSAYNTLIPPGFPIIAIH